MIENISELKEIIIKKDEIIKELEYKLKKYIKEENDNLNTNETKQKDTLNFDIELIKYPIYELNFHTSYVLELIMLKDGRIASASYDKSIIIYNKTTFKPDLIIKEHKGPVYCIIQLSSGILASCSDDKTIKLFNINGNNYNILQTLRYHSNIVYKIIELKNKQLVSCSYDNSVIVYFKENNEYLIDYQIPTNERCTSVIQTKNDELCYSECANNGICFYDIIKRKKIITINNINKRNDYVAKLFMITEDLLFIGGEDKISLINVNQHNLIRIIDVPGSSYINTLCMLNENIFLTGDSSNSIKQWKIEGDNLILIANKENAHDNYIHCLLYLGNNHFASGADDRKMKIWYI